MNDFELAERISNSAVWEPSDIIELVRRAGLEAEYEQADGETFESIVYKAAAVLGVEIF